MKGEWQPIETAPKDYTRILVADDYDMQVVRWGDTSVYGYPNWVYGDIQDDYNTRSVFYNPKYWQPLPEMPE